MSDRESFRIHLRHEPEPADRDILDAGLERGLEVTAGESCPDPERVRVLVDGRPGAEGLVRYPGIRHLVIPYAGIPPETRNLLLARPDVTVHNLHHNAAVSAEMAIALLLAAAKMVVPMDRALRRNAWSGRGKRNPAVLLSGRTALVLGYGAIGRRVARLLLALEMEVLAVRRRASGIAVSDGVEVHSAGALPDLLPRATVLIVCVPLTEETRGLLGETELGRLPPGAVLVNVARGPVVDEAALYGALESGRLHSAGIDVWYRYPGRDGDPENTPPSAHPFGELENVVMSPHRGGWLHEAEALRMRDLAGLLNALARGELSAGRVDLAAGY
jgi:phosphoglycerate dehydrogenase-like enzyme